MERLGEDQIEMLCDQINEVGLCGVVTNFTLIPNGRNHPKLGTKNCTTATASKRQHHANNNER
eukprot:4876840-Amphidinium_carterae.1